MNDNLKRKINSLATNKGNEFLTQLDATYEVSDKLEAVVEAIKSIPVPEPMVMPEHPKEMSINNFPEVQTIKIEGLSTITLKGDKGDTGPQGPQGIPGRDGFDGKDGVDGKNGVDGKDGNDGVDGVAGANGSPDSGTEIVDKINSKENIRKISLSKIEGIEKLGGNKIISSGVNSITAGNNVTITSSQGNGKGDITISSTGGTGGSPNGPSGSLQYNDGAGGFAGTTNVVYDQGSNNFLLTTREYITINSATPSTLDNPTLQATNSINGYTQLSIENKSAGTSSSADIIAYPNNIGTDEQGFVDMGITSSTFSDPIYAITGPNESYIFASAPLASGTTGNLIVATDSSGTANEIAFFTGGFDNLANERVRIKATGITTPFDVEITDNTKGIIMKSPNGTRFRIGITNNGELTATSL